MAETHRKSRPKELKTPLLSNPGKGCATFQRFNGDPLNSGESWSEEGPLAFSPADRLVAEHYLPSTVAYCRWFWEKFEPEEGKFDWSMVEGSLKTARERGQTLQVRFMAHGSTGQPQLPAWYQRKYAVRPCSNIDEKYLEPNYDGPEYLDAWGRVITEFGKRYDGHPDIETVDTAILGPWGEGAGEASDKQIDAFLNLYTKAHTKTPVMVDCAGYQFRSGINHGTGWRFNCYGDLRRKGNEFVPNHLAWNHMYDFYPMALTKAGAQDAWKKKPVTLETCAVPLTWFRTWFTEAGDLEFVLQQGLKYHCSVFMPKSNPIPDEYMKPLAEFCDRLGYRFVLRQARWQISAKRGKSFECEMWIENTGVAPVYREYKLAVKIKCAGGEHIHVLKADARKWLPGDAWIEDKAKVPNDFAKGDAMLYAGLVHPQTLKPAVRFANEGTEADGWMPLDTITIE
jgi:hypothetical protein